MGATIDWRHRADRKRHGTTDGDGDENEDEDGDGGQPA
jgi:hypothetical protein